MVSLVLAVASSSRSCIRRLRRPPRVSLWRSSGVGWGRRIRVDVGVASFESHGRKVAVIDRAGWCLWNWPGIDGAGILLDSICIGNGNTHLRTDSRRTSIGTSAVMKRLVRMAMIGVWKKIGGFWTDGRPLNERKLED